METNKQKALVAAGWALGDAADFLEMSEVERQLLDARTQMAAAVRAKDLNSPSNFFRNASHRAWELIIKAWPTAITFKFIFRIINRLNIIFIYLLLY
jgi:hypothetical protein